MTASGHVGEEYVDEKELLGVRSGTVASVRTELKDSWLLCRGRRSSVASVDEV